MRKTDPDTSIAATHDRSGSARLSPLNVAIGIAISVLLHGLLALWTWNMKLPSEQATRALKRDLEVRLLHESPPSPPPVSLQELAKSPGPLRSKEPLRRSAIIPRPPPAIALNPSPAKPYPVPPESSAPPEKHLDLSAVHANLGTIVAEVDREKRDTPVGQLQNKPLYPQDDESKIGKAINNTTRPDCRDSIANTGLLAPLFLLAMAADKKDGGCKW